MTDTATTTTQFLIGETYWTRLICDYHTILTYRVVERTRCFITTEDKFGNRRRSKVKVCGGVETAKPELYMIEADKPLDN